MYNGQKIRELLKNKKIKNKELISGVGWSGNSQLKQVIEGDPKVSTLEKVADFFGVPMDTFFERSVPISGGHNHVVGSGNNVSSIFIGDIQLQERIRSLETLLEEKDKRIAVQEEIANLLREQLSILEQEKK